MAIEEDGYIVHIVEILLTSEVYFMNNININTDDISQIEFVRQFLTYTRREFNEYREDTMLKHQAFSNVIILLAYRIKKLENHQNKLTGL